MTPLFKKLNIGDHDVIHVISAPASFKAELAQLTNVTVKETIGGNVQFAMAFVVTQKELDSISNKLVKNAKGDAILWMVYPKGSSKKYSCEFNRDSGWDVLKKAGFDTVRMVAIDEDWSALRFRRIEYIKK
ncbi:MAG TPA: hypothetical protein VHL14_04520 [Steroidobacteraceae bacterium]|nr:hypothetical protein [Steroidobacteraceae bacterium]